MLERILIHWCITKQAKMLGRTIKNSPFKLHNIQYK